MGLKKYRAALARAAHSGIAKSKAKMGGFGFLLAKFGTATILGAASKNSHGIAGISALRPDTIGTGLALVGYIVTGFAFRKYRRLAVSVLEGAAIATVLGWVYRSDFKFMAGEDGSLRVVPVNTQRAATPPKKRAPAPAPEAAAAE